MTPREPVTPPPTIRVQLPAAARHSIIPVVGEDAEWCDRIIRSAMAGRDGPFGEVAFDGWIVQLRRMAERPDLDAEWGPGMAAADGVLLVAHHLDFGSLQALCERQDRARRGDDVPWAVLFCRPAGVREFKISCPICRQKLWVQDDEIGKHGRCPHCAGATDIPSPADLLRRELRLSDRIPILSVDPADAGLCRGAVASLLARKGYGLTPAFGISPVEFLKKATVAILPRGVKT